MSSEHAIVWNCIYDRNYVTMYVVYEHAIILIYVVLNAYGIIVLLCEVVNTQLNYCQIHGQLCVITL